MPGDSTADLGITLSMVFICLSLIALLLLYSKQLIAQADVSCNQGEVMAWTGRQSRVELHLKHELTVWLLSDFFLMRKMDINSTVLCCGYIVYDVVHILT